MSKLNKELLMDYLYDELSAEDRQQVEALLAADPQAQKELAELQGVRHTMAALPDQPVERPLLMMGGEAETNRPRGLNGWQRTWISVAAMVLLATTIALVGGMQLSVGKGGFTLAFNGGGTTETATPEAAEPSFTRAEVESMLQASLQAQLAERDDSLRASLANWQASLDALKAQQNVPSKVVVDAPMGGITQEQFELALRDMQQENLRLMVAMIQNTNQELKQDFEKTLFNFAQYYDLQRSEDLNQVEMNMASLKQNNELTQQQMDYLYNVLASNPQ